MQWSSPLAVGNYQFWQQLLGTPQTLSPSAGGYAKWGEGDMRGRTFLGRPLPFSSVSVYDRNLRTIVLQLRLPLSASDATRLGRVDVDLISYAPETQTLTVMNDNLVGLVALLLLVQRLQIGSLASNAVFGAYISLAQSLRQGGRPDMPKIRGLYQGWYDRLGPGTVALPAAPGSARERFSLGLRRQEHLSSVAELVSSQRQYDRMSHDGLLQRERLITSRAPGASARREGRAERMSPAVEGNLRDLLNY